MRSHDLVSGSGLGDEARPFCLLECDEASFWTSTDVKRVHASGVKGCPGCLRAAPLPPCPRCPLAFLREQIGPLSYFKRFLLSGKVSAEGLAAVDVGRRASCFRAAGSGVCCHQSGPLWRRANEGSNTTDTPLAQQPFLCLAIKTWRLI